MDAPTEEDGRKRTFTVTKANNVDLDLMYKILIGTIIISAVMLVIAIILLAVHAISGGYGVVWLGSMGGIIVIAVIGIFIIRKKKKEGEGGPGGEEEVERV